jgi:hypothetical protein
MNEMKVRHVSGWKVFGIIAGALAFLAVVAVFWLKMVTDRRREALEQQLNTEIAAIRARPRERSVPAGTAQPGNAWVDYDQALAASRLITAKTSFRVILDEKHDDKPGGPLSLLPQYASPIADLRRGARRAEARKDYEWEQGSSSATPPLAECHWLASYALLDARVLANQGKSAEAVDEILDVLQFGRDMTNDGMVISYMIGNGVSDAALGEVRDLLAAGTLDVRGRQALERGLRILDAGFPSFEDAIVRECVGFESSMCKASPDMLTGLFYLGAVQRQREFVDRTAAAGRVSWQSALQAEAEIQVEATKAWNPITKMVAPSYTKSGAKSSRQWRAHLRMLLVAVHYQDTGEVPDFDDPFATKLRSSIIGDKFKIWSAGPDGVDDAGSGAWRGGKDLVLEVSRP